MPEKLVTIPDTAAQLDLSTRTIWGWRAERKNLEFVQLGRAIRIKQSSIDRLNRAGNNSREVERSPQMPPHTHSNPRLSVCTMRRDLLIHEELLRSDLRIERDYHRQLDLAASALAAQNRRHQHQETCPACRLGEA